MKDALIGALVTIVAYATFMEDVTNAVLLTALKTLKLLVFVFSLEASGLLAILMFAK
jgi:hypothetical protein